MEWAEEIERFLETHFELHSSLRGIVEAVYGKGHNCEGARIIFSEQKMPPQKDYSPRPKFAQLFSLDKANAAGALEGAKVQYDVYIKGPYTVAVLRCIGGPKHPKALECLLTSEKLKELDI